LDLEFLSFSALPRRGSKSGHTGKSSFAAPASPSPLSRTRSPKARLPFTTRPIRCH